VHRYSPVLDPDNRTGPTSASTLPKQSLEESWRRLPDIFDATLNGSGTFLCPPFSFETRKDKFMHLMTTNEKVTFTELLIHVITWIGIPNELNNLHKECGLGLLASKSVKAARRTRISFERSMS